MFHSLPGKRKFQRSGEFTDGLGLRHVFSISGTLRYSVACDDAEAARQAIEQLLRLMEEMERFRLQCEANYRLLRELNRVNRLG